MSKIKMNPAITEKADLTGLYLLTLLQLWSFFFQVIPYSCSVHDMTILHDKMIFKSLLEHFSINTKERTCRSTSSCLSLPSLRTRIRLIFSTKCPIYIQIVLFNDSMLKSIHSVSHWTKQCPYICE